MSTERSGQTGTMLNKKKSRPNEHRGKEEGGVVFPRVVSKGCAVRETTLL